MPIYEYVCKSCNHVLETLQFLNEEPLTDCPECGEPTLRRKISAAGFRLGGKGWYETDFKSQDKQRNLAGDKKPAEKSEKKPAEGGKGEGKKSPGTAKSDAPKSTEKGTRSTD